MLPDVQLRAGIISRSGVQKGVDSKIMVDLIELSNNHAITDAVLLTGDGDLVIGIELAQKRGVRVAALGIEDSAFGVGHNQSFELVCIADRVRRLARRDIEPYLAYVGARAVSSQPSAPSAPNDADNEPVHYRGRATVHRHIDYRHRRDRASGGRPAAPRRNRSPRKKTHPDRAERIAALVPGTVDRALRL
jgi:hypothetical protein